MCADLPRPPKRMLLKDIALLWTAEDDSIHTGSSIFVDNGFVQWVGHHSNIPASLLILDHVVEDMSDSLVTPGFVNTHHHMYQSLTKCMARDSTLFHWLQTLYPIWKHLTPDMVYKSAKFAMGELLLSGCTTTSDHLYIFPNGVRLDDTIRAAREMGIRFHPCRGAMSIGTDAGGLPPQSLCEHEPHILDEMNRAINEYHDSHDGAMLRIALAPCSPFSVSTSLMQQVADLARTHQNVMLHTHLAENQSDVDYMSNHLRMSLVQYLRHCKWNRSDCWFAHCVKLSTTDADAPHHTANDVANKRCDSKRVDAKRVDAKRTDAKRSDGKRTDAKRTDSKMLDVSSMEYFARNGMGVAHCPVSNCRLGSGMAPVREMLQNGIRVGLGVDGSASNDGGNILSEARMALMIARAREARADALSPLSTLRMATVGGAAVLGRSDVGNLAAGKCADLAAWRLGDRAFAGTLHSKAAVLSALVMGHGGELRPDLVMVNGVIVVRHGQLVGAQDMDTITREHNEAARDLARSAGC